MVNRLYGGAPLNNLADDYSAVMGAWNNSLMTVLEDLRTGKVNPDDINMDLFKGTKDKLLKGVEKGAKTKFANIDYSSKDYNFQMELRSNVYAFARCKNYQHLRAMNDLLLDKKGNVVSFQQFQKEIDHYRREVLKLEDQYNKQWLEAEYNMAIAQAQSAVLWKEFEANKDIFPHLRYVTAGDERVRHSHQVLNGIVKHIDDPIWNKIAPVKDWGCRCVLEPTDDPAHEGDLSKGYNPNPKFEGNVGKDGSIFPDKHPYKTANQVNLQKMKEEAEGVWADERKAINKKIWGDYENDPNYVREQFNEQTGGFLIRHKDAQHSHLMHHPTVEQKAISHLVEKGNRVIVPEFIPGGHDITIDNSNWSIREVTGDIKARTEEQIRSSMGQAGNVVVTYDRELAPDDLKLIRSALGRLKDEERLNALLFINDGKQAVISRAEMERKDFNALKSLFNE